MNVLSLFDGMSCGQIALERAGLHVDVYFASEIDKHAIKVTQKNYPNTIQLGDVQNVDGTQLPKIDLLLGGSPCSGFSFAGKQLNFNDPRSRLFFDFVRILKEAQPKYFLFENVRMKKEYESIITKELGVDPIIINSALVSAQNRVRLYWTNIKNITQPADKGIVLADIIENGLVDRDKSFCIDSNYFKGGNLKQYFNKSRRQLVFKENPQTIALLDHIGGHKQPKIVSGSLRGRHIINGKRADGKGKTKQRIELRADKKTNCLSTVQKDTIVCYPVDNKKYYSPQEILWRKLTPLECERLQTLPDNYSEGISSTQRYKMIGNGWTVDVITHILNSLIM